MSYFKLKNKLMYTSLQDSVYLVGQKNVKKKIKMSLP